VKDAADVVLDMNQDAMIHKSAKAERSSQDWSRSSSSSV
jgi:hypothetical protein